MQSAGISVVVKRSSQLTDMIWEVDCTVAPGYPSVKALAMGFQGALGTDFMVPSYLAVSYIRDFLEEMKHMEL